MRNRIYRFVIITSSFIMADTIYVPEDQPTIQEAINISTDGDSILVSPGFYPESIDFDGKAILISSLYLLEDDSLLVGATIIDAQENGSVVTFSSGETSQSIIQGFTIQNGTGNDEDPDDNGSYYTYGGGIYCQGSDPVIRDCIIQDNTANEGGGGGIFCYNASPKFYGCSINGNETDDVGGGLYSRVDSSPEFYDCTFFENTAEFGAGCYLRNESSPIMENVVFNQNTANNSGGGITLKDDADLQAEQVFIFNNEADGLGGGLYVNNADPQFSFSLIADNVSSSGAGAYIRNNSTVDFTNLTMANNSAGLYGNGMYMRDNSDVSLLNTVVWGNGTPQIYFRSEGTEVELGVLYSIIENGEDGIETNDNGELNWGAGNLEEEPYFCNSSAGNYYVRENSSCIDGGAAGALIGCFGAGCGPVNVGPVWYVDSNGNNANDGSLDAPFETISRAVLSAVNGDTIRLNPGVYTEMLDFDSKTVVLESRAFSENDPNMILETYFAPGQIGGSCLLLDQTSNNNATIRGISFRGGSHPYGGGIAIINSTPTLEHIIVEENTAEIGGGIYISGSDPVLKNITVRNNGGNLGGGIYVTEGSPLFEGVVVENNIAYWGGGFYFENAEPTLRHSAVKYNEAFIEGAGLYQNGGISTIEWTAFEKNNGYDYGGGIVAYQASIDLDQTTFSGNTSGVGSAMAFYSSVVTVKNSIIWDNDGPILYVPESSGITYLDIGYSDITGGEDLLADHPNLIFTTEGGIINQDPEFCFPEDFIYNLQETSICQTASDSSGVIGAYSSVCGALAIEQPEVESNSFALLCNYPNPFNPTTNIKYTLTDHGYYTLSIYDVNGGLVKNLRSGHGSPGEYTVLWDSTNDNGQKVATGLYFYHLSTKSNILKNKMTLVK